MILSFGNRATEDLYHGRNSKAARSLPSTIASGALKKLDMLNAANDINDLRCPPGNRLEKLKGDLEGLYSIRINDQWRIVFRWEASDASEVRILDYH